MYVLVANTITGFDIEQLTRKENFEWLSRSMRN